MSTVPAGVPSLIKQFSAMKPERSKHEPVWRECFDYSFPMRGSGLNQQILTAQQGQQKKAELLASVSTDSVTVLASAIVAGMTPSNSLWLGFTCNDETDEERRWLEEASRAVWENIHAANFDSVAFENAVDWICAGWFALYIDEDREKGGYVFEQWPLSQVYVSSTRIDGVIDTVFRVSSPTAEQVVREYGEENVSERVRKLAVTTPDAPVDMLHAIYPRKPYAVGARMARNLPIASCHVEINTGKVLRESGYHEMPVVVPRWMRIPGSVYAVGKMFDALPDVKELNHIKILELANLDLATSGMWIAEDDGVLNPRAIKIGPRKIIIANSVDSMKPLTSGADFNVAFTKEEKLEASIRRTLLADQLPSLEGSPRTALEVQARINMIRQLLGPIYGRGQSEYLKPMAERCFGLAYRAGVLGQAPRTLANKEITVRYLSPLARSQKLEDVNAIQQLYGFVGQIAAAKQSLDAFDYLNDGEAIKQTAAGYGAPASAMRSADEVAQLREQRQAEQQQAQAEAQQSDLMQGAAQAAMKRAS